MPAENNDDNNVKPLTKEEIEAQVAAQVEDKLKEIKTKLDGAFAARDEAIRKATQLEADRKQKELDDLTAAGKHTEVTALKMTALEEELKIAKARIVTYERDSVVKEAIGGLEFRNDRSREMAYRDVVDQLVQDKDGQWVHKTGVTIKDYVTTFAKDEDNSFLFKPKSSGGAGTNGGTGSGGPKDQKKKITEMTTQEALAAAMAGEFGQFNI